MTFPEKDGIFILTDVKTTKSTQYILRRGFYTNIESIIEELNVLMSASDDPEQDIKFGYDKLLHKVYAKSETDVTVIFRGKLARILGFEDRIPLIFPPKRAVKYAPHVADIYGGEYALFLYTDIIEHQLVGDHFVPLLRCVQITGEHRNVVTITYDKAHYVRVCRSHIDDIVLEVKSDQNSNIPFQYGKVVAKLHFRPVKQLQRF